ncbi:roadblock/LC7 domain-containing protein [bacterium]|nr:roadblock/LC7 domain-containing protein [bacterium]
MMELSEKEYEALVELLKDLADTSRAWATLLADKYGELIAGIGDIRYSEAVKIASLASTTFSSMQDLSKTIGEKEELKILAKSGKKFNIVISPIKSEAFLVIVTPSSLPISSLMSKVLDTVERLAMVLDLVHNKKNEQRKINSSHI